MWYHVGPRTPSRKPTQSPYGSLCAPYRTHVPHSTCILARPRRRRHLAAQPESLKSSSIIENPYPPRYTAQTRPYRNLGFDGSLNVNDDGSLAVVVAACPAFCNASVNSCKRSARHIWRSNDNRNSTHSSNRLRPTSSTPPTAARRFCGQRWSSSVFMATVTQARTSRCIVRCVSGTLLSMTQRRRM